MNAFLRRVELTRLMEMEAAIVEATPEELGLLGWCLDCGKRLRSNNLGSRCFACGGGTRVADRRARAIDEESARLRQRHTGQALGRSLPSAPARTSWDKPDWYELVR